MPIEFVPIETPREEPSLLETTVQQHGRDIEQQQKLTNLILTIMTGIVIALFLAFVGYFADLIKLHTESYQQFTTAIQVLHK